jgi:serine phosphatase RsbU (regulator of sigma subunit)
MAMLAFLIRRFALARSHEEHLRGQFEAARAVQQLLLPEDTLRIPGFQVDSVYLLAESVGGDFFQILPDGHDGLLIVLGDVAGKGLPAAMMVSMLVGAIRVEAGHTADPASLLALLNVRMLGRTRGFATCLAAHLSSDGCLTIANAGHLPPYQNGAELQLPGSLPLGLTADAQYAESILQLVPGDSLTFLTDGNVIIWRTLRLRPHCNHLHPIRRIHRSHRPELRPAGRHHRPHPHLRRSWGPGCIE